MTNWWRNAPLHLKLNLPIQLVLLLLLPIAHVWLMDRFEANVLENVQLRTQGSATQSLLALNSMMLAGTIGNLDERAAFHGKMSLQHGVENFHLVRGQAVQRQFGPGLEIEQQGDELDRLAAETGVVQTETASNGNRTLRVVVPFKARTSFYGTNCLQCHFVPEGTVLGTISLKVDLEPEYRNIQQLSMALLAAQIFLQILLFLLITWFIRTATKSVVALESTMLKVKDSADFTMRADVHGNDEIGLMAQVFNDFVAHIEDLHLRLAEKLAVLKGYYDKTEEELRVGSDIMSRITDAQSTSDPNVRMRIQPAPVQRGHHSGSRTPPISAYHAGRRGEHDCWRQSAYAAQPGFKAMTKRVPGYAHRGRLNLKTT
jgi:methyl-accepting chemotaxis protein